MTLAMMMARATGAAGWAVRRVGALPRPRWRTLATALVGLGTLAIVFIAYCAFTLPLAGGLLPEPTAGALVLEDAVGSVFATRGVVKGDRLAKDAIPPDLAHAMIAIEDRRFYGHPGIDPRGMLRAAWRDLVAGGVAREGG